MVSRPIFAAVFAIAAWAHPAWSETVFRCTDETNETVSRRVCAWQAAPADIKVEPPEAPPPPVTDPGKGLSFTLPVPAPEPPPALVALPEREPARPDLAIVAPPPPPFPIIAVVPPPPLLPPAARPEPVEPPPPAAAEALPDVPPDIVEAALKRLRAGNKLADREADEALAFYRSRGFRPLWIDNGRWGVRAEAVRAVFAAAPDDGLDSRRYRTVAQFVAAGEPQWPALAAAEAQMTEAVLIYARDAAIGRVKPGQVHPLITPRLQHAGADKVLAELTEAQDAAEALRSFHPPHPQYARLRAALAHARAARPAIAAGEPIPDGPPLRVGMRDPRVPLIRARLGMGYDNTSVYDREVSIRVAGLQRANGLPVNGAFTPQTRRMLAGEAPSPLEAEIAANMEFWRWMPRDLGADHIFVNTPAHEMEMRRGGEVIHQARIIVGKAETQTPFFSDMMDHIVVNPSWYIPPGILEREPKYLDPAYAAARGYEIRTRGAVTTVRVPPSSSNALGYVKFMFPNEHAVYLHDTPNRGLFNARVRTLSNGCVRVENPMRLAALLFAQDGLTEDRFRRMQGGGERRMNLPRKLPVHLAYFTLVAAQDGGLTRHPDVYGHAARLRQLLGLS